MPVIISTHNNTIGGSIKPDYILYTEKKIEDDIMNNKINNRIEVKEDIKDNDENNNLKFMSYIHY